MLTLRSQRVCDWLETASTAASAPDSLLRPYGFDAVGSAFGSPGVIFRLAVAETSGSSLEQHIAANLSRVFLETLGRECSLLGFLPADGHDSAR